MINYKWSGFWTSEINILITLLFQITGIMSIAPIILPSVVKQTATIIFLHGLGDTGHGWADEIARLRPANAKVICPTAPNKPVTINNGALMPAWYDVISLNKGHEDKKGIEESAAYIQTLIQEEVDQGISPDKIVLSGFSQGAAMSLYTGLTGKYLLGGIVALSGYLPLFDAIKWDSVHKPPILQCHGDQDDIVHYNIGLATKTRLEEKKFPNYTFNTYKHMGHTACDEELMDVKEFYNKVLQQFKVKSEL